MNNLEVLNGEMALKYDKNIDTYSIKVSSDVDALEIKYELDDTSTLNVYGNTLLSPGENKVILACKNNENIIKKARNAGRIRLLGGKIKYS